MSVYSVRLSDGREFEDVWAKSPDAAKDRVFYWTHGRCSKDEMSVEWRGGGR